jgi:hypothetical protein
MSSNESSSREYALDVELGERYYRGDGQLEEQLIEETIAIIKKYIDRRFDQGRRPALRAAHAEATGRVCATFQVDDDLRERAPDLMRGVFATPGRTYQAWIRFSNGNSELQNHHLPDPRGMAIKLLEVVGDRLLQDERHTQDFILVNRPVFFGDDLERYNAALRQFLSGGTVAQHWSLTKLNLRAAPVALRVNLNLITNPLFNQYWSMTPYRLGTEPGKKLAVKYTAIPNGQNPANVLARLLTFLSPGFSLQHEMDKVLRARAVSFDFCIQRYRDSELTPIEDCKTEWRERNSPPVRVARIVVPSHSATSAARRDFGENLSFNPWHGLQAHRPLGAVNRVRRKVYLEISNHRHALNKVAPREPSPRDRSSPRLGDE